MYNKYLFIIVLNYSQKRIMAWHRRVGLPLTVDILRHGACVCLYVLTVFPSCRTLEAKFKGVSLGHRSGITLVSGVARQLVTHFLC